MGYSEAEAVKLFANAYLAMRISFFNELDTYAEVKELNSQDIINGICSDPRIGNYYNNPSFGYGGYCLPKDSAQLLNDYIGIPEKIISAIVSSNHIRKYFIAQSIYEKAKLNSGNDDIITIGIYRITMKSNSDNYRNSSIIEIIEWLISKNVKIFIYEPSIKNNKNLFGCEILNNCKEFKKICSLIVANRFDECLNDVKFKVYTRDIFHRD